MHAQALENLKDVPVDIEEIDALSVPMLAVSGTYFAAEKVLDVVFMRRLHAHFQGPTLWVGIPRKGVLLVIRGFLPPLDAS